MANKNPRRTDSDYGPNWEKYWDSVEGMYQWYATLADAVPPKPGFHYRWAAARPTRGNVRRAHRVLSQAAAVERMMKRIGLK